MPRKTPNVEQFESSETREVREDWLASGESRKPFLLSWLERVDYHIDQLLRVAAEKMMEEINAEENP